MYIKKPVLIGCAILLVIVTAVVSIGAVNPFGFTAWGEFLHFTWVSRIIQSEYYEDVEKSEYVNTALEGIAAATEDPYTRYLWGETAEKYRESIEGNFCGIGIYIENNAEDDTITVVSAIAGTPAEEAGLVTGDKILAVNGNAFTGMQINDAVAAMRGQSGTMVKVTVLRIATQTTEELELMRKEIVIPSIQSQMVTDGIGMIRITQFTEGTAELFAKAYRERVSEGMQKLVLDLRNNPGGIMTEAAKIANMFIADGDVIVYTLDKAGKRTDYPATGEAVEIPIVILTNPGSASASEILTGALKDYGLAHHIGEKTYGKGVVQGVFEAGEDALLSVTVSRYYTPNGTCIHGEGISPDEEVPMDWGLYAELENLTLREDLQLQKAIDYLQS